MTAREDIEQRDFGQFEIDRTAALFDYHAPTGRLSQFVDIFWYWQGHDLLKGKECALPNGGLELVLDLNSHRASDSLLSGPRSKSFLIENNSRETKLIGVHFRPGGAFPLLPFPSNEIHNIAISLEELWGRDKAALLLSRLHQAKTVDDKFRTLEAWLLKNLLHPLKHHAAVSLALTELKQSPASSTARLAERANLSQRRFIEVFSRQIGMTPKLYSRVARFQRALARIPDTFTPNWAELATDCGYFDQPHFIHDFRELSGITPSRYLALRTEQPGHLPA